MLMQHPLPEHETAKNSAPSSGLSVAWTTGAATGIFFFASRAPARPTRTLRPHREPTRSPQHGISIFVQGAC